MTHRRAAEITPKLSFPRPQRPCGALAARDLSLLGVLCVTAAIMQSGCERQSPPPTPVQVTPTQPFAPTDPKLITANNRGVGFMGKYEYENARAVFQSLLDKNRNWLDVKVNLAIATLNRQREGDEETALRLLDEVLSADSHHLRARYCIGLLRLHLQSPDEALPHFQLVAEADPKDAYAAYYVGQCLSQQRSYEDAAEWYDKAIALDGYLRSAYYAAAQAYRALQREDDAKRMLDEFLTLEKNPRARLVEFKYTRMGPKSEALAVNLSDPAPPAPKPQGPIFADPVPLLEDGDQYDWVVRREDRPVSITACDINSDGLIDVFIANVLDESGGARNAVCINHADGKFTLDTDHVLAHVPDVNAALWGDCDNDGLTDVYLCRRGPNMLWRQSQKNAWKDVTATTETANGEFDTVDGAMFDADHDGDLDIFCVNFDGPNELLNNNMDGTFKPIAQERGVSGDGNGSIAVVPVDIDGDRDVDILVTKREKDFQLLINDRLWQYQDAPLTQPMAEVLLRSQSRLSEELKLDELRERHSFLGWAPIIINSSEGPGLVGLTTGKTPVLFAPGLGRYRFATVSFSGRQVTSENRQVRSNASGIGTHFAARIGSNWVTGSTLKNSSGPGQSLQPIAIGLGGHPQIDFISIDWSDGVFQTEMDLKAGEHHVITETQRQLSSCPVLFAWNGNKYELITDVLGVGGMGYLVAPNEYATPRPWERLLLPPDALQSQENHFVLKLSEPMEEVCYLDAARLVVYDLPPVVHMTVDDRMSVQGPEPTGKPVFYRVYAQPIRAVNDRGVDVTETIVTTDHRAAPVGELDERFIGRLRNDHALTIEFHPGAIDPLIGQPVLIADGWVEYPYSQTMFAASQAKAEYRAPTIEAFTNGQWHTIHAQFGYPAGMPRQMSVPLPGLTEQTTKLRITTNQEIYWDRLIVAFAVPMPEFVVRRELKLSEAKLVQSGFAKRTTGPQRLPQYDYDERKPFGDTRYQRGYYTQVGPMRELIEQTDDAVAIFGSGEEIHMEFIDDLPPVPNIKEGAHPYDDSVGQWTRRFVLEVDGWCKDMDLFTKDGETVEPLPRSKDLDAAAAKRRDDLHKRFNTRFQSGK